MTDETTKAPETNPAETDYLAGTPQFEHMKKMAIDAAKQRFRESLRPGLQQISERRAERGSPKESLATRSKPVLETLENISGMTLEEQALTQFACMTQSGLDCMIRAAADQEDEPQQQPDRWRRNKPMPAVSSQNKRRVELEIQSRMAASSALLLDALTRMRNNGCHQITYNHIQSQVPKPKYTSREAEPLQEHGEEWIAETTELGVDMCFDGMEGAFDEAYSPSPAES